MEGNPSVVVVSCSDLQAQSIVESLVKDINAHEINTEEEEAKYLWHIDTKYYTAEVNIQTLKTSSGGVQTNIEAIVIYFDSSSDSGLEKLQEWKSFVNEHGPDVKLLITDVCNTSTRITNLKAIEWCLEHGFEFIELNPVHLSEASDEDELIKETRGIQRVIEALQTHVWSNLVMKTKSSEPQQSAGTSQPISNPRIEEMLDSLTLDDDQMEFGELFQRLHAIKESVQSMSVTDRRHCAEQVVAAFWRVIGGDDDELGNI